MKKIFLTLVFLFAVGAVVDPCEGKSPVAVITVTPAYADNTVAPSPTPVTTTAVTTAVTTTATTGTNTTVVSAVPVVQDVTFSDVLKSLPGLKQGVMWNIRNRGFNYLMTAPLASYKKLSLEAGYSLDGGFLGAVTYPIANLKDYNINLPILNLVSFDVGFGVGYDRGVVSCGPTLTLIDLKF